MNEVEQAVYNAIMACVFNAIDRKGYVPCSMATATRNATITDIMGVECYSKTDVVSWGKAKE